MEKEKKFTGRKEERIEVDLGNDLKLVAAINAFPYDKEINVFVEKNGVFLQDLTWISPEHKLVVDGDNLYRNYLNDCFSVKVFEDPNSEDYTKENLISLYGDNKSTIRRKLLSLMPNSTLVFLSNKDDVKNVFVLLRKYGSEYYYFTTDTEASFINNYSEFEFEELVSDISEIVEDNNLQVGKEKLANIVDYSNDGIEAMNSLGLLYPYDRKLVSILKEGVIDVPCTDDVHDELFIIKDHWKGNDIAVLLEDGHPILIETFDNAVEDNNVCTVQFLRQAMELVPEKL